MTINKDAPCVDMAQRLIMIELSIMRLDSGPYGWHLSAITAHPSNFDRARRTRECVESDDGVVLVGAGLEKLY
jgi:hypothetical protein